MDEYTLVFSFGSRDLANVAGSNLPRQLPAKIMVSRLESHPEGERLSPQPSSLLTFVDRQRALLYLRLNRTVLPKVSSSGPCMWCRPLQRNVSLAQCISFCYRVPEVAHMTRARMASRVTLVALPHCAAPALR